MSDQLDALFERLRGQSPPVPFAPAAAVRRRGRQRANRQAVSVGVAVLAVTGLGAGSVVTLTGGPGPDPVPPPAATGSRTAPAPTTPGTPAPTTPEPARTEVLEQWLLTADDLGSGDWVTGWEPEWFNSDPFWLWGSDLCAASRTEDYPSLADRTDLVTTAWTDGPWAPGAGRPVPNWVGQVMELFEPGAAEANLRDIRAAVGRCGEPVLRTPGVEAPAVEVVGSGFAGDESLLVVQREPGDVSSYTAVVRVRDVVTTVRSYDVELARADDANLRSVAVRAADRLR